MADEVNVTPQELAAADQELAEADKALDVLIGHWRQSPYGSDRVLRVAGLMGDLVPYATATGLLAVLAVAVGRLAGD